jgi:hypothetical protein
MKEQKKAHLISKNPCRDKPNISFVALAKEEEKQSRALSQHHLSHATAPACTA